MYDRRCWKQVESKKDKLGTSGKTRIKTASISSKLKKEGKIDRNFLIKLANVSLDDLIALKLETAAKTINEKLFGFELFYNLEKLVKVAVVKYIYSTAPSRKAIWHTLGISSSKFKQIERKYNLRKFFFGTPSLNDFYAEKAYKERIKRLDKEKK